MSKISTDISSIAMLLKQERYYRDTAEWDLCRATFHPDAALTYVNVAWYEGDVQDFLLQSKLSYQGHVNILHSSFDPVHIQVHGQRAISDAFCLITKILPIEGIDYELASYVRLASRLSKLGDTGEWRILSLEAIYVRDRLVTAFPTAFPTSPLVLPEDVMGYPKSYRCLAFAMSFNGLKPRMTLPHEGDFDSVNQVLENNQAWLNGAKDPWTAETRRTNTFLLSQIGRTYIPVVLICVMGSFILLYIDRLALAAGF